MTSLDYLNYLKYNNGVAYLNNIKISDLKLTLETNRTLGWALYSKLDENSKAIKVSREAYR